MASAQQIEQALGRVKDQKSLLQELLSGALEWRIPEKAIQVSELGYGWTAEELRAAGIEKKLLDGQVRQLQLRDKQPWGIFVVEFAATKVERSVLRKVLRGLVPSRRRDSSLPAWKHENLFFLCTTGDYRSFTFAHFRGENVQTARLASFRWSQGDRHVRTLCEFNLPALAWPEDGGKDEAGWLKKWSAAFDVEAVTNRFFEEYAEVFHDVEEKVKGVPKGELRRLYTQRLFNRLLFLYFIQRKGWLTLNGDKNYLRALLNAAVAAKEDFLNERLYWSFFYGLNNGQEDKKLHTDAKLKERRGEVPFLNGGLFDLEDEYDAQDKVKIPNDAFESILRLFERYNFTVAESTPLDVEVAVDPEMLGKVFEELVTGRHESGSYYTPRPIVAFMCREALKHYLFPVVKDGAAVSRFVDDGDPSLLIAPEAALDALKKVKVCDPACGSGAYLLGMMQELLRLRDVLFAKHHLDHRDVYDRKLEIIQNNLYGVDIDLFAVNIAKLRLWLSLAVDFNGPIPPPLPNLDFKIECGDSLTAPSPQDLSDLFRHVLIAEADELADLKVKFIAAHGAEKKKLRKSIEKQEATLAEKLPDHSPDGSVDWRVAFADVFRNGGFDIALENPPYVRMELFKNDKPTLKKNFPAVYDGLADLYVYFFARTCQILRPGGVACVITTNKWLKAGYAEGLRRFFATSAWVAAVVDFGHAKQIFQSADVFPSILVLRRPGEEPPPETARVCAIPREQLRLEEVAEQFALDGYDLPRQRLGAEAWSLEPPGVMKLMDKIREVGVPINKFTGARAFRGLTTGFNDAFLMDRITRDHLIAKHPSSAAVLKPFLRGRDVKRWQAEYADLWLAYIPWHFPLQLDESITGASLKAEAIFRRDYPAIYEHLRGFKKELSARNVAETGVRYEWYTLQRWGADYWTEFTKPKIVYSEITWRPEWAYDTQGMYGSNTVYFLQTSDLWILGVVNSPITWWFAWRTAVHGKDEALRFIGEYVQELPIPRPTSKQQQETEICVGRLVQITGQRQLGCRTAMDYLRTEFAVEKPSQKLQDVAALEEDAFVAEVQKVRGKRQPLSLAAVKALKDEHARSILPLQTLAAEARQLEARVADLVNAAYGLTPEEIDLMWKTAPPRMPGCQPAP